MIGLSTARALVELGVERRARCSSAPPSARAEPASRAAWSAATTASGPWPPWPGTRCRCSSTPSRSWAPTSGYHRTGYLVGVGPENLGALRANVAMHRELGIEVELRRATTRPGAVARAPASMTSPRSPTSPRGLRRRPPDGARPSPPPPAGAGPASASSARWRPSSVQSDRVSGVRLVDGRPHRLPIRWSLAAGPWSVALAAAVGVDLPIAAQRAQILLVDPGRPARTASRSSPTWCRCSTSGPTARLRCWWATATTPAPSGPTPTTTVERADDDDLVERLDPEVRAPVPGPRPRPRLSSSYAGCYDVTPDYNPVISASPVEGLWLCAGFSGHGYKISPAVGELMADLIVHGSQPPPRRRPPRLPLGALRRGPTAGQPPSLRRRRARCAERPASSARTGGID